MKTFFSSPAVNYLHARNGIGTLQKDQLCHVAQSQRNRSSETIIVQPPVPRERERVNEMKNINDQDFDTF